MYIKGLDFITTKELELEIDKKISKIEPGDVDLTEIKDQVAQLTSDLTYQNIKDFGAVGDGITDDTVAIQSALDLDVAKKIIYFPEGTYLIKNTITSATVRDELIIIGENAIILGDTSTVPESYEINFKAKTIEITGITFHGLKVVKFGSTVITSIQDCEFNRCTYYGINITTNTKKVYIKDCHFKETGYGRINAESGNAWETDAACRQDIRFQTSMIKRMIIENSYFEKTEGHASIFVIQDSSIVDNCNLTINGCEFTGTRYKAIQFFVQGGVETSVYGEIKRNNIHECGTLTPAGEVNGGVGRNGIYAYAGASHMEVINNKIKNLYENGIEGTFKCINGNRIENTGIDPVGHPTVSQEGIYGLLTTEICKNTIINPGMNAIMTQYFTQTQVDQAVASGGVLIEDNILIGNGNTTYGAIKYFGIGLTSNNLYIKVVRNTVTNFNEFLQMAGNFSPRFVPINNSYSGLKKYASAKVDDFKDNRVLLFDYLNPEVNKNYCRNGSMYNYTKTTDENGYIALTTNSASNQGEVQFHCAIPNDLYRTKKYQYLVEFEIVTTDTAEVKLYTFIPGGSVNFVGNAANNIRQSIVLSLNNAESRPTQFFSFKFTTTTIATGIVLTIKKMQISVIPYDSNYILHDNKVSISTIPTYIGRQGETVYNDLSITKDYVGWIYIGTAWKGFGPIQS